MSALKMIDAEAVHAAVDYPSLVDALREIYRVGCDHNELFRLSLASAGGTVANFLLRPAWQRDRHIGVKLVSLFPDNNARGLPSVLGISVLRPSRLRMPSRFPSCELVTDSQTIACMSPAT